MPYRINMNNLIIYAVFLCMYILPVKFLMEIGVEIQSYLFMGLVALYYVNYLLNKGELLARDLVIILISLYFSWLKQDISHLHLLGLIVLDKLLYNEKGLVNRISSSKIIWISVFFSFIYSVLYFGRDGRFIYAANGEVNQSGLALLLLFLIIRVLNKKIGSVLLLLGLLTFSRNYLLALCIFFTVEIMVRLKVVGKGVVLRLFQNFKFHVVISSFILIIIYWCYSWLYQSNSLAEYGFGLGRFLTVLDYSNYFRFQVNYNLIEIYMRHPEKLITGITNQEFFELNYEVTQSKGELYRVIKPHNYFFSYLQIYGVLSLFVFYYLGTIFKKIVNRENLSCFLILMVYAVFLGTGLSGYWLYMSSFLLLIYKNKNEITTKI